ncbi:hypothetical protein HJC23_004054 [Cyclotella cryptica]|uniref:Uncharacterized protein n=1 Tax=Cyclotella cryptica TaxID=29204 RepID=A0ABD3QTS9_9STRA|eukprot:CCRYP_002060-RA/>CCRYP_002060-RA protein AED:0.05 eAED:0.05 QI:128/1/1/1/1/1/2/425/417
MPSTTASTVNFRIVSRRAQALMQKHIVAEKTPASAPPSKRNANDHNTEAPWPASIRYTFYSACAAAVPFAIGSAIAMSPRLRDSLADDTDSESPTNKIVHLVRQYWGSYDYLAPVDRPTTNHVAPGLRLQWQEDNWSSFLAALGLNKSRDKGSAIDVLNPNARIPISLENEPPANIRYEQSLLSRYLSPEYNPSGVNARLSLIPCGMFGDHDNSCRDFDCNLPANASLSSVREVTCVSNSSDAVKKLESLFPGAKCFTSSAQCIGWDGTYRFAVEFNSVSPAQDLVGHNSSDFVDSSSDANSETTHSQSNEASKILLHHTSIHSSWSYFPDVNTFTNSEGMSSKVSASKKPSAMPRHSDKDLTSARVEQLKYQISTLEKELKDPSSLRDRDDMYAELKNAKEELKGIAPKWWKQIWA